MTLRQLWECREVLAAHRHIRSRWLVYSKCNIADALDWPRCLLLSYGFMLHHRGISFNVDYNSHQL